MWFAGIDWAGSRLRRGLDRHGRIDDPYHTGLLVGKRVMVSLQRDHFGSAVRYLSARCAIRGYFCPEG
jgi:hypothetical protein